MLLQLLLAEEYVVSDGILKVRPSVFSVFVFELVVFHQDQLH